MKNILSSPKNIQSLSAETALRQMTKKLHAAGFASAALDARLLLQGAAGVSHADLLAGRAKPLNAAQQARLAAALERRLKHESVHRILGHRAFYGLDLELSAETLEPRPDTEALIDLILPLIKQKAKQSARKRQKSVATPRSISGKEAKIFSDRIQDSAAEDTRHEYGFADTAQKQCGRFSSASVALLDMGTGSGAIALALLAEVPQLCAVGADIAAGALQTAQKNAAALGLAERFTPLQSDWFGSVRGRFDFIVSNPPYIPHGDIAGLDAEVRLYDPRRALDGGADGLDFYRALAAGARAHLAEGGFIAVEVGFDQAAAVTAIFSAGNFTLHSTQKDLGGITRALLFAA